ncbi:MAG: hypothetical protein J0I19_16085 [Alphaproteobacteria bacterium]|nr:hypothetical protein [Alphaproteobacteria bacterium]
MIALKFGDWLLREALVAMPNWEEQWIRQQRERALDRQKDWKLADRQRLQKLGLLPSAERLLQKQHGRGRGVVAPVTSLGQYIVSGLNDLKTLFAPETPPSLRKETYKKFRWFPEFVEQAYRGELNRILSLRKPSTRGEPRRRASELAEERVAEAAGISSAQVRKLCHQARKGYGGSPPPPPTSAAELKAHLELGPSLVRSMKKP